MRKKLKKAWNKIQESSLYTCVIFCLALPLVALSYVFNKRGLPRDWNDRRYNNRRYVFICQSLGSDGKYYATLRFLGIGFAPDFDSCCYVMDKPLPSTPLFDRGNSVDDITAINLGGDPLFEKWNPD